MAQKRMIDKKIRFGLTIKEAPYSSNFYMVLIPMNANDPNLDNWIQALRDKWQEICELRKDKWIIPGKPEKQRIVRRHTLLKWKVFNRDNFTCKECGAREDLEIDHIKPVTKGGTDDIKNLQTLCKRCNVKKSNKYGEIKKR